MIEDEFVYTTHLDELAALRAQNAELMAALEPFAKQRFEGTIWEDTPNDTDILLNAIAPGHPTTRSTIGDFRRARALLAAIGQPQGSGE